MEPRLAGLRMRRERIGRTLLLGEWTVGQKESCRSAGEAPAVRADRLQTMLLQRRQAREEVKDEESTAAVASWPGTAHSAAPHHGMYSPVARQGHF
jgi:hypothetical protein